MRRTVIVLAGIAGLLLSVLVPSTAQAATHSISGRITVPAGFNVQQVTVVLDDQNGTVTSTNPDASGDYGFTAIQDNTYRVRAYGPDLTQESTTFFTLSSNIRGKNLTLFELFTVSGTVTPANSGLVYFYDSCAAFQAGTPRAQGSITGGMYSVEVPAGDYRVLISSNIASWHYGELNCNDANVVSVTGDLITPLQGIAPARIKGRVTYNGAGVEDAFVSARRWDGVEWKPTAFAQTAADGTYTIADLPPGTYRVRFDSVQYGSRQLPGNWWEDAQTLQAATDINVTAGATVQGIDALKVEGASISGVVTGPGGPRSGALVTVNDAAGQVGSAFTKPDGSWKIDGLWPGSYKLSFEDADGSNQEFWNDKPTLEQAETITVTNLENRAGLDAWLGGPDPCEFQKNCPAPPPVGQQVKAPPKSLKRGKRAKLATSTAQGGSVTWKTTTKKICKVKQNRVRGLKRGKCIVRATSPATTAFTAFAQRYTIRIR